MRKRGASGYDDDDDDENGVENDAFLSDVSLSKSKPLITKKNDFQKLAQRIITVIFLLAIFALSFSGALKGRLHVWLSQKSRKSY